MNKSLFSVIKTVFKNQAISTFMRSVFSVIIICIFSIQFIHAQEECTDRYRSIVFRTISLDGQVDFESWSKQNGGRLLRYDVYSPKGDTAALRPLIILWHGGAFVDAIKKNSPDIVTLAKDLAKTGYVVITPDYRGIRDLSGFGRTEDMIKVVVGSTLDANDAVCHILSEIDNGNPHRINKDEIFAGGVSAGAIIGLHGLFLNNADELGPQFAEWAREIDNGRIDDVLTNKFCGHPNIIKGFFSVSGALVDTSFIQPTSVKFLHIHGTHDDFVPFDVGQPLWGLTAAPDLYGSKPIHEKSLQSGIDSEFMIYEGGGHVPYLNLDEELLTSLSLINKRKYNECLNAISDFLFNQITCEKKEAVTTSLSASNHMELSFYPNPVQDIFQISMPENKQWQIQIFDLTGKIALQNSFTGNSYTQFTKALSKGMYIVQISENHENNTTYTGKIIKQ